MAEFNMLDQKVAEYPVEVEDLCVQVGNQEPRIRFVALLAVISFRVQSIITRLDDLRFDLLPCFACSPEGVLGDSHTCGPRLWEMKFGHQFGIAINVLRSNFETLVKLCNAHMEKIGGLNPATKLNIRSVLSGLLDQHQDLVWVYEQTEWSESKCPMEKDVDLESRQVVHIIRTNTLKFSGDFVMKLGDLSV